MSVWKWKKNTKKCCVDKDLDTDVGADIALDYQHKIVQEYVRTPDSNLEFSQWTQLFENEMLLAALIIVIYSHIFYIFCYFHLNILNPFFIDL